MSLEAKLLLQEFRTLVAEFGDKLPMTERYRESLLNRLHAELKSLRPEEARTSVPVPLDQLLWLARQRDTVESGYVRMEAQQMAINALIAAGIPLPQNGSKE